MLQFTRKLSSLGLLTVLVLATLAPPSWADDEVVLNKRLEEAVDELAAKVADYVKNTAGVSTVSVGAFTEGQGGFIASFGPAIKKMMIDRLAGSHQITTQARQNVSFKGEYTYFADAGKVQLSVAVMQDGLPRKRFTADVYNVSDVAAMFGATGVLSVSNSKQRIKDLNTTIVQPAPQVIPAAAPAAGNSPSRALAAKNGQFAVEIWRLKSDKYALPNPSDEDYEPLPIERDTDNFLRVNLELKDRYAVRLINNTPRLAAATLTIDGLNLFAFSEIDNYRKLGKVVVPPGPKGVLIKGWHRNNNTSNAFEVCDVGESAAAQVQNGASSLVVVDDQIGVISVLFAAAVDVESNDALPSDEPQIASVGTNVGPVLSQKYRETRVKIGLDREIISIRYNHAPPPPAPTN